MTWSTSLLTSDREPWTCERYVLVHWCYRGVACGGLTSSLLHTHTQDAAAHEEMVKDPIALADTLIRLMAGASADSWSAIAEKLAQRRKVGISEMVQQKSSVVVRTHTCTTIDTGRRTHRLCSRTCNC